MLSRVSFRKNRVFALQVVSVSLSLSAQEGIEKSHVLHTPFNYFEWKVKMVIQLRSKGLYRVTMGTENNPNSVEEKTMYFNRLNEAFKMLCLSVSRDILSHVDSLTTPNELWLNLESLFGHTDEMRGHQLENELITLR